MGRHGGGSSHGGCSSNFGNSGSSSSHSRTSTIPFHGCYNRSYYDRGGRLHNYYTDDSDFGTQKGWGGGIVFLLIFIIIDMCITIGGVLFTTLEFGEKVKGDTDRIFIEDRINLLTDEEEQEITKLFYNVYEASGMPVTLYIDDFSWKSRYQSLMVYSEELYYKISYDEDAMLILFTANPANKLQDWEYDIYCGDDTTKCFSDAEFDKLLNNFQKAMHRQDLVEALQYSWDSVMEDIGKTNIHIIGILTSIPLLVICGFCYIIILGSVRQKNEAYEYFKKHPGKLSMTPMILESMCPNCGAVNNNKKEICEYCGSLLTIRDNKAIYQNYREN